MLRTLLTLVKFYKLADFIVDHWGQIALWVPGATLLSAALFALWAGISKLHSVEIITIALVVTAAMLVILTHLPQYLQQYFPRPFAVSVPTVLTEGGDRRYNVKVHIRVINLSRTDPLLLEFALCFRQAEGQEQWSHQPELSDMITQVKPKKEVEGVIAFYMGQFGDFIPTDSNMVCVYDSTIRTSTATAKSDYPGGIFLHVIDRWSGRDKYIRIPGSYPPGYFAPPILISSGIS